MKLLPSFKLIVVISALVVVVPTIDSDTINSTGTALQQSLDERKTEFESMDFDSLINRSDLPVGAKEFLSTVTSYMQGVSKKINSMWISEGLERSEIAFACLLVTTNDQAEMMRLRDNLASSMGMTDPDAVIDLGVQLNEYRAELVRAAFYKERCQ